MHDRAQGRENPKRTHHTERTKLSALLPTRLQQQLNHHNQFKATERNSNWRRRRLRRHSRRYLE